MREPMLHSTEPASGGPPAPSQAASPTEPLSVEIAGAKYTEDQIKQALGGLDRVQEAQRDQQADYTRKTQDIARKRKEVEEMETRARKLLEKAEREVLADSSTYDSDALNQAIRPLQEKFDQFTEVFAEERRVREERERGEEVRQNRKVAVASLKGRPFINDDSMAEIQFFMERNNLGPEHVSLAYSALFGAQIGELKGRQHAIAEGIAAGPPLMGSGNSRISPGFTAPNEAPGTEVDVRKMSWDDMKTAAMNAQDKPNF